MSDNKNRQIHELMGFPLECSGCEVCMFEGDGSCITILDYSKIENAREALQFAVEQKGVNAVGMVLCGHLLSDEATWEGLIAEAALAPASVLCDAVVSIFTENEK